MFSHCNAFLTGVNLIKWSPSSTKLHKTQTKSLDFHFHKKFLSNWVVFQRIMFQPLDILIEFVNTKQVGDWTRRCTVGKNEKFTLTVKIFCEINSSVTSLVKTLLSRNFYQKKKMRAKFCNFHTVCCTKILEKQFTKHL